MLGAIQGQWEGIQQQWHIYIKELVAALIALRAWQAQLQSCNVVWFIDNQVALVQLVKGSSTRDSAVVVQEFLEICIHRNIQLRVFYIPTKINQISDKLSRQLLEGCIWPLAL